MEIAERLREIELEALDSYRRGLNEPPVIYRDAGMVKAAAAEGPIEFVASEESEDRMGDVILASGWTLDNYKTNPVFMLSHDYNTLPIGTVPSVKVEGKQLLANVAFDSADPLAASVEGKYRRGVMRAVSVGFRALDFVERGQSAKSSRPGFEFKKVELLEISAVSVPAHPVALMRRAMSYPKFFTVPDLAQKAACTCGNCTCGKKQEPKPEPQPKGEAGQLGPVEVEQFRAAIKQFAS